MDEQTRSVALEIAATIRELKRAKNMPTAKLAERSGLDRGKLELILRGESEISLPELYVIAGALEVRPARLLAGIEWIPDESGGGHIRLGRPK
jgi:transcriptional regulator with XRE-family HTH domain